MARHRRWRWTSLALGGYLGCLLGLGAARLWEFRSSLWLPVLCLPLIVWLLWRHSRLATVVIFACCTLLGNWRGGLFVRQLQVYQSYSGQQVAMLVTAADDSVYGKRSQLSFAGTHVVLGGQRLAGRVQISGFGLPMVYRGDTVGVTGKLSISRGSTQARMSFAQLHLVRHHISWLDTIRRKFGAGLTSVLPEPQAPFALGLLIGQRSTLDAAVQQDLLMVGLTHIVAVSGYNLTIMLRAGQRAFGQHLRRLTFWLSISLIVSFLLITGASASIVRAAVVSTLSLVAAYYGRRFRPLALLALAATITAWASPFYLWSDASWWLSFLAFFGILLLSPPVHQKLPQKLQHSLLVTVALESICAEAMTLPFILHAFGQMSLVGLPANVLIATLVPLAMLLSFIAGVAGVVAVAYAGWVAWPAKAVLGYMLSLAHTMAAVPHVFLQNLSLSLGGMLFLYAVVALITFLLNTKTKEDIYAKITDKNERTQ